MLEVVRQVAAHAPRWRVFVGHLGMLSFEARQFAQQCVELLVRNSRTVQDVVVVVMVVELFAEFQDAFLWSCVCHDATCDLKNLEAKVMKKRRKLSSRREKH